MKNVLQIKATLKDKLEVRVGDLVAIGCENIDKDVLKNFNDFRMGVIDFYLDKIQKGK